MTTPWIIPENLLENSVRLMRPHGALGNEGIAFWLGSVDGEGVRVTHILDLCGRGIERSPLNITLSLRAMEQLTDFAYDNDLYLVGQIHSHPKTFVNLSRVDKAHGIRFEGYLSVVCPHYAQDPQTSFSDCGIHVYVDGEYRTLTTEEQRQRIRYVSSPVQCISMEVLR